MIILLCQAIIQAAPNTIYVRDAAGNMSEWKRIAITAAVGTLLGVLSSLLVEMLKPRMEEARQKRRVSKQLIGELEKNLARLTLFRNSKNVVQLVVALSAVAFPGLDSVLDVLGALIPVSVIGLLVGRIDDEIYQEYLRKDRLLMREIDSGGHLKKFYKIMKVQFLQSIKTTNQTAPVKKDRVYALIDDAVRQGQKFIEAEESTWIKLVRKIRESRSSPLPADQLSKNL
jgi:hypothetical protein